MTSATELATKPSLLHLGSILYSIQRKTSIYTSKLFMEEIAKLFMSAHVENAAKPSLTSHTSKDTSNFMMTKEITNVKIATKPS